tara:strand:+ start:1576 stop:2466 length:891 start_codon:yes stop_codon:yes gene_type:complete
MKRLFQNQFLFNEANPEGGGGGGGGTPAPAPEATPTPSGFNLLNPDLTFAEGYQEQLGEHAKGLTFKNLPDVFKSVKEGTATITRITQEKADLAKKIEELGGNVQLPADVASYKQSIKLPESMPEGVSIPENLLDEAAAYALANKISPEVTNKFIQFQVEQAGKDFKSFADKQFAAIQKAKGEISQLVGEQNYSKTIADAQAAHDLLGLNLTAEDLIQNTTLVTSLAKIHTKLEPATLKALGVGKEGMSAESKLTQAQDILNNPSNALNAAFYDNSHPQHKAAQDQYNRLILESAQ